MSISAVCICVLFHTPYILSCDMENSFFAQRTSRCRDTDNKSLTYRNAIVTGIIKFPNIACRYGAVRLPLLGKTVRSPPNALKRPTKNNCECGNLRSVSPSRCGWNRRIKSNAIPKITTNEIHAKEKTKNPSTLGWYSSLLPVEEFVWLVE